MKPHILMIATLVFMLLTQAVLQRQLNELRDRQAQLAGSLQTLAQATLDNSEAISRLSTRHE